MSERLKELRKSLKMNQTNFAKQIGITQTAYSMIENGKLTTETQQHLLCIIKELLKIQNEFVNKEQKYDAE